MRRLVRKLEREAPGLVQCCDEAGPCGYALQRQMTTLRVSCQVIALALIPRKPGERIKTNRRDARTLGGPTSRSVGSSTTIYWRSIRRRNISPRRRSRS